jgi:S-formylglutathione hydrolase FrmB
VTWLSIYFAFAGNVNGQPGSLRFEVRHGRAPVGHEQRPDQQSGSRSAGRLLVILGKQNGEEPRLALGRLGKNAPTVLGCDVLDFSPDSVCVLDRKSAIFPIERLDQLQPGTYAVQAVFHTNRDLNFSSAPGDRYSPVSSFEHKPGDATTIQLELSESIPPEALPPDEEYVRYVKIRSRVLSEFHGRPIDIRAGVILPRDYKNDGTDRYPVRIHIGGYGSRFSQVGSMMSPRSSFFSAWMADDAPRMILIHLDGVGPLGDPYQVDSANHGPYGSAVTRELIPFVEGRFRGIGNGGSRVVDGGSTGGWVALALQIFYPDFFNGAWAFCPDSVDFRSFQLLNIYDDDNAYVNRGGFERPAAREVSGDVRYTMRHECQLENVLGQRSSWALSGGQWGAWNATYGPRDADGRPRPLWDPVTGAIDHQTAIRWRAYDLRQVLEDNWRVIGPKLQGKLHIWIGDADDFFLNNAVHRLDRFLARADPPYGGSITYGPGEGHCWMGISQARMMQQMAERFTAGAPTSSRANE